MLKRILYAVIILAIIIVLSIMWTDNKKKDTLPVITDQTSTLETDRTVEPTSINEDLDSIQVDSGIDADIDTMNTDIKSL